MLMGVMGWIRRIGEGAHVCMSAHHSARRLLGVTSVGSISSRVLALA